MKLKNNWKRFWTLDRHHAAGFTLVELIVVIAILAILAGVGIPVYSGYITKANISNDHILITDIIRAGEIGFYTNYDIPNDAVGSVYGYAVVTETGIKADENLQKALVDAFGDNYASNVLKSTEWTTAAALATLSSVGAMDSVAGSSFVNAGIDNLMGDVQYCATSLANFLEGFGYGGEAGIDALDRHIGGGYVRGYLEGYKGEVTTDVLSNAVVFGLAEQLKKDEQMAKEVKDNMSNGYYILRNVPGTPGYDPEKVLNKLGDDNDAYMLTEVAATYAQLEAFSAHIGYDLQLEFTGTNTAGILSDLARECQNAYNYAIANEESGMKANAYLFGDGVNPTQAAKDADAYLDVMTTISDVKGDYKDSLTNANLFGSEQMIDRVNGYVAFSTVEGAADQIAALFGSDKYGVAIVFTVTQDGKFNSTVFQTAADPRG